MRYPNARNWARRRRVETLGVIGARGTALMRENHVLERHGLELHPTKGFRRTAMPIGTPILRGKATSMSLGAILAGLFRGGR